MVIREVPLAVGVVVSFCTPTQSSVCGELPLHCQYQFQGFPKLIKSSIDKHC